MENNTIDNNCPDKEIIRKNLRNGLTNKKNVTMENPEEATPISTEIPNLLTAFNEKFRNAGGKYLPCDKSNLVKTLVLICQKWGFNNLLNTSPNLGVYLNKYGVPHVNAIAPHEVADAAVIFSDILVARTGAIGFTQVTVQYPSIKNLARNLIIVSRERCIFPDMEDALAYQQQRDKDTKNSTIEFIIPRQLDKDANGKETFTGLNPRIILLMVEENPQPATASAPVTPEVSTARTQTTPLQNEPEAQEPAD